MGACSTCVHELLSVVHENEAEDVSPLCASSNVELAAGFVGRDDFGSFDQDSLASRRDSTAMENLDNASMGKQSNRRKHILFRALGFPVVCLERC
jgi:hypothetical protein